jgi:hypothetical protein
MHQIRSLLASLHSDLLFWPETSQACSYNRLPLRNRGDVKREIERLADEGHISAHQEKLLASFNEQISDIWDIFVPADYDCILKGKVWAAVDVLIQTFHTRPADALFSLQCDILAIPVANILQKIQCLQREALCVKREYYIPSSLIEGLRLFVLTLSEAASAASTLMAELDQSQDGRVYASSGASDDDSDMFSAQELIYESPADDSEFDSVDDREIIRSSFLAPVRRRSTEHSGGHPSRYEAGTRLPQGVRIPTRRRFMKPSSHYKRTTTPRAAFQFPRVHRYKGHSEEISNPDKRTKKPREGVKALPRAIVSRFLQVIELVDASQDELVRILQPENNESPEEGRMMDRGKLIAYVMESILHGHSNSPILPKISLEDIYLTYTTQLVSVSHLRVTREVTASHNISHCAIALEYPEHPKPQSFI